MKRSLLLLALAVFALGFAAVHDTAQDSASAPATTTGTLPGPIQMNQIAVLDSPAAGKILSTPQGFDLDHDGQREFILRAAAPYPQNEPLEFYESIADNTFALVHALDLENNPNDVYGPAAAGDIDEDGLADFVVLAHDWIENGVVDYGTRVYESESADAAALSHISYRFMMAVRVSEGCFHRLTCQKARRGKKPWLSRSRERARRRGQWLRSAIQGSPRRANERS